MRLISLELESKLREKGLWPESRTAWATFYVGALDLLLYALQLLTRHARPSISDDLEGWVTFLSGLAIVLLAVVAYRWLRSQLLWRLRNRLIVTYVFIGVIPVFLLVVISVLTLYLFAGQFASFVVTSDITTRLRSMESANRTVAHHLSTHMAAGQKLNAGLVDEVRPHRTDWARRQVCAWYGSQPQAFCSGPGGISPFSDPVFVKDNFREIVRDHGALYLRTATVIGTGNESLRVISSEPLDRALLQEIASELGEVTLLQPKASATVTGAEDKSKQGILINSGQPVSADGQQFEPTFTAGTIPAAGNRADPEIIFGAQLMIVDWDSKTGEARFGFRLGQD